MKILVYFQPSNKYDNFEGARMRKTIKGALETIDVQYTSNLYDECDVAHFMSPDDENKLSLVAERGVPTIVSALFGEDDPSTRFIANKIKDGKVSRHLRNRAFKMLNKATLVIVPSESAKQFLISEGITSRIEIAVPGINLARFNFSREDEKELFYRYFREDKNKKVVLAVGDYDSNMDGIHAFINAANKRDDTVFYYVGYQNKDANKGRSKKIIKSAPKNVRFKDILPDDIYRSLLLNADVFMLPGYTLAGIVSVEEAMAAKCQLIVRKSTIFPEFLENEKTAYIAEFSETLTSICLEYLDHEMQPTVKEAYNQVSEYSLKNFGDQLVSIYKSLIKKE